MEMTPPLLEPRQPAQERYLRLPKQFASPETATGLFSLFEELSHGKTASEQYSAGWAITEAALVSLELSQKDKIACIQEAEYCWIQALQTQQKNAVRRSVNKNRNYINNAAEYRIASALAAIPVFLELPSGAPKLSTVSQFHRTLLDTARLNVDDFVNNKNAQRFSVALNYEGLAYEHFTQLAISRTGGRRLFACSAFARSDNGTHYPSQTHDVQILHLDGGTITAITPTEVKRTLQERFFERYRDVSLVSGLGLLHEGALTPSAAIELFEREVNGIALPEEITMLEAMTDTVIHSIQHHRRPERYGRHCLRAMNPVTLYAEDQFVEPVTQHTPSRRSQRVA